MADVFVSYVSEDRAVAEGIAHGLTSAGLSVWWDRHIQGGVDFSKEIARQLDAAKSVVVLWSAASLDSQWVRDEAQQARDERKLVPVRIDAVQPPLGFRQVQTIDLRDWAGDVESHPFMHLLSSLRSLALRDEATSPSSVSRAVAVPVATPRTSSRVERDEQAKRSLRRGWWAGAVMVVVALAVTAWMISRQQSSHEVNTLTDSIEVSAFEPLTKTDQLERLARDVTATMSRVLAADDLRAVSASATGGGADGATPRVEFVLRGTVDGDADKLTISVDLLHRREGRVMWSTTAYGDAKEARVLQEQYAGSVASVLRCALHVRERSHDDVSTDLLTKYLRLCDAFDGGRVEEAPELARRIVEAAPRSAWSYWIQALANAIVSRTPTTGGMSRPPAEIERLRNIVFDSAKKAVEIDPKADPYYARAVVADPTRTRAQYEELLQRSIDQDPTLWSVLFEYGFLLQEVGRTHEARAMIERAVNTNPISVGALRESAMLAAWLGNIDAARKQFQYLEGKLMSHEVDALRFWAELWFGDPKIAKQIADDPKSNAISFWRGQTDAPCLHRFVDARASNERMSLAELDSLCARHDDRSGYVSERFGLAYLYFGYADATFEAFEERDENGEYRGPERYLYMPGNMGWIRSDPRFMKLATRRGLVDYWLETDHWPDFCTTKDAPYDCKTAALAARDAEKAQGTVGL